MKPQSRRYSVFMMVLAANCAIFFAVESVIDPAHRAVSILLVVLSLAAICRQYVLWNRARTFKDHHGSLE